MNKLSKISCWILGGLVLCIVFGCLDGKPSEWDVAKNDNWEIWSEGVITSIKTAVNPDDTISNDAYEIVFDNGKIILAGQLRNPGTVKVGETGTLYKQNLGNKDSVSWFQWVGKSRSDTESLNDVVSETTVLVSALSGRVSSSKWVYRTNGNPERYSTVLIKFKNDTMSLGYINNINEWKLSINENEEDGGDTVSKLDIISWKNIDIQ